MAAAKTIVRKSSAAKSIGSSKSALGASALRDDLVICRQANNILFRREIHA